MNRTELITAFLHTRNRPEFVLRCLKFYDTWYRGTLVILDASESDRFDELKRGVSRLQLRFPLTILHHSQETALKDRFSEALRLTSSPYVVLMADDDFHFQSGMQAALDHLEAHPDCGVVYGHVIDFQLGGYVPAGELRRYANGKLNPPDRWLQGESPLDRLAELSKGPWWTTGWYAVQRTAIFRSIIETANEGGFSNGMLERAMTLLQPIHAKVAKLDTICLARQANPQENRRPGTFRENAAAIAVLEQAAANVLVRLTGVGRDRAQAAVASALSAETRQLRRNEHMDLLRKTASRLGLSRPYAAFLDMVRRHRRPSVQDYVAQDRRLPLPPQLSSETPEVRLLDASCRASLPSPKELLPTPP